MSTARAVSKGPTDEPSAPASATQVLTAWVDIENPPQVQYLVPVVEGFQNRGLEVLVTARDYGETLTLLERRDIPYVPVGRHFGAAKIAKVSGSLRRAQTLRGLIRARRPDVLVSASRSAALAARSAAVPSFALCDYEYVNLSVFRAAKSYVVHPSVIAVESLTKRGVRAERLMSYAGIKEDITFADVDIDAIPAHRFTALEDADAVKILVRPPAEESHYHASSSSETLRQVLAWLAARTDAVTIYSPRYAWQAERLAEFGWQRPPIVLDAPVDFVSLYKGVDIVFSGGGTMTREAAYIGIPAVTIFQGVLGDVDHHLASLGRITLVATAADLDGIDLGSLPRHPPLRGNPRARDDVVDAILAVVRTSTQGRAKA